MYHNQVVFLPGMGMLFNIENTFNHLNAKKIHLIKFHNHSIKTFIKLGIEGKVPNLVSRKSSCEGLPGRLFKGSQVHEDRPFVCPLLWIWNGDYMADFPTSTLAYEVMWINWNSPTLLTGG